jgi:hypothetical protein
MADGFLIGSELLGKIRTVVGDNEANIRKMEPYRIATRLEGEESSAEKTFRVCTFTGSWSPGSTKTVALKYKPSATLSALNLTFHLPDIGTGPYDCEVAKDGTAWFLVSAMEQNVKRGTFAAPWNKNTIKTVALYSGGSVSAVNRHANITGTGTKACTVGRDGMDWELIAAEC